jgi:hydroxyacylglutathione hydrolase
MANNLALTVDREPGNERAGRLLEEVRDQDPDAALVSDMALEREINTFLRLRSPAVIERLRKDFPDLPENPDPRTVFLKLRELRNSW